MKIALIGLPQSGKKTIFSLLTGIPLDHLHGRPTEFHVGTVKVADPRLDKLAALYQPQRTRYAEIDCILAPPMPADPKHREQWLNHLKEVDALCHVVRAFEAPAVFHVAGSVDPLRDIDSMNLELAVSDLALIETRLHRIAQDQKKRFDQGRADEEALLKKLRPHLEAGKPLRDLPLSEPEQRLLRSLQFFTLKGLVLALNLGESNFPDPQLEHAARARLTGPRTEVAQLCAKLEIEIAQIENPAERAEFLAAMGIEHPAIEVLGRQLFKVLGYISFFTVVGEEVRAWSLRHGSTALDAAGSVHTDLARGFIRAEVMKYDDLVAAAAEARAHPGERPGHAAEHILKERGKVLLKGRDYVVEDGDILHIRHSG
jgi:GTP-binding protein YchF